MTKINLLLGSISIIVVLGVLKLFEVHVPSPVGTAVIAEKQGGENGQIAVKLPESMTAKQHRLLNMAYETAKKNGFKNPEVLQAVVLQETMAGGMDSYRVANPGKDAYFGPAQIKLAAAKDVLQRWPELFSRFGFHTRSDDEIKAFLILDEKFNLEVAAKYLLILKEYGFNGRQLLNAYNRGPGGVHAVGDDYHYAVQAERKLASYKPNRRSGQ